VLLAGITLLGAVQSARAATEVVVAERYLLPRGHASHASLFLYREDGQLVRKLTTGGAGQDSDPGFASDGKAIVFTRLGPGSRKEFWSVATTGRGLRRLEQAPGWYIARTPSPCYHWPDDPSDASQLPIYRSPDGAYALLADTPDENGEPVSRTWTLRNLKIGKTMPYPRPDGWGGQVRTLGANSNQPFLLDGALRTAFVSVHRNDSHSHQVFALNLERPRMIPLSIDEAVVYPLRGDAAFLSVATTLFDVAIPHSDMHETSQYLERWNAHFHHVRYGTEAAAWFYGASVYRPGRTPTIITVPKRDR